MSLINDIVCEVAESSVILANQLRSWRKLDAIIQQIFTNICSNIFRLIHEVLPFKYLYHS